MFQIIGKQNLNSVVRRIDVRADAIVSRLRPGQFVSVMADRYSRCIPMNVYEVDFRRRCLSLVFEEKDPETKKMGDMRINDYLFALNGPYGVPLAVEKTGPITFIGEGIGLASIALLCRSFKQAGNKVTGIAGFEKRNSSVLENQLRLNCTKFYVMYKDGTHDRRGDILAPLKKNISEEKPSRIYAHVTERAMKDIECIASVNGIPLWVNIMGMIELRHSFMETDAIILKEDAWLPSHDGIWVNAVQIDINSFVRETDALKEYVKCRKNEAALFASKNVWARLKKFIWG